MQLSNINKKLSTQHRAFYCYIILSIWIFLLLMAMKKYMDVDNVTLTIVKSSGNNVETTHSFTRIANQEIKTQKVYRACNLPQYIKKINEGGVKNTYELSGVLVILRHGDRGPLSHVQDISSIDCTDNNHPSFAMFESSMENMSLVPELGPFHGFPLVPDKGCHLGQLTRAGALQLLVTGEVLRAVYANRLSLNRPDDVLVYSTKYRRTFQSALAFLYTFLTPELLHSVAFKESASLQFCFNDCACPASDMYLKKINREKSDRLKLHPAVLQLVNAASLIVYEVYERKQASDPYSLRDALLAYVCHGASLPCVAGECITWEQVSALLSYIDWEARHFSSSPTLKRACLLRAYGMIRDIVSRLVRIISEGKPRFVMYSGHDKTILYLATALGVSAEATYLAQYASRLIIEVYHNTSKDASESKNNNVSGDYYFRLLFNGLDATDHLQFCKSSLTSVSDESQTLFLCPIHTIIQFVHNDYFASFNASNFKDACSLNL